MDRSISKKQSQILQAIAVLMMLFHHFFTKPDNLTLLHFFNAETCMRLAWLCKLCVATFAFISGYGMNSGCDSGSLPDLKKLYRKAGVRILKLYTIAWLMLIFFKAGEYIFLGNAPSAMEFILNATGLFYTYNGSWWYIFFYVLLCLFFPLIRIFLTRVISVKRKLLLAAVIAAAVGLFYLLGQFLFYPYLATAFLYLIVALHPPILLAYIAGICVSEFGIYDRLLEIVEPWERGSFCRLFLINFLMPVIVIGLGCTVRIFLADSAAYCRIDCILVPIFVLCFILLCKYLRALPAGIKKGLEGVFLFFGKYSTGIWLSHVLVMGYSYEFIARLTRFVLPFYLAEVILSLICSVLISSIAGAVYGLAGSRQK